MPDDRSTASLGPSRSTLSGSLRARQGSSLRFDPLRGLTPLTRPSAEPRSWQSCDGPGSPWSVGHRARFNQWEGRAELMNITSITPSIGVTIGRHTRLYYAYITTAPAAV